jgi:hypothetical protein
MAPGSDSSAAPQRQQESGEQQSASATPSQSQSQAQQRGQSGQRFADDARLAANPSPRRSSLDDKPERSGIFA